MQNDLNTTAPAKLPWETPLLQPLDVAQDTQLKNPTVSETVSTIYAVAS